MFKMGYNNFPSFGFMLAVAFLINIALMVPPNTLVNGEFSFGYQNGTQNPSEWGHLHEQWKSCLGYGHRQSPIQLNYTKGEIQKHFIPLNRTYNISKITMINRGQDIMMRFENPYVGGFVHSGTNFYLRQLHWHKPSEHLFNGERFDVEMHMVHTTHDNKEAAVIAFLYLVGSPDPFLEEVEPYIRNITGPAGQKIDAGMIDPRDTMEQFHGYYRYMGSLTTPPCTEGVVWTVMRHVRPVSKEQVELLIKATPEFKQNARPIQNIDHRHIKFYQP